MLEAHGGVDYNSDADDDEFWKNDNNGYYDWRKE